MILMHLLLQSSALHTLSEQSYENKALTFGCIIDPKDYGLGGSSLSDFLDQKNTRHYQMGFGRRTLYLQTVK